MHSFAQSAVELGVGCLCGRRGEQRSTTSNCFVGTMVGVPSGATRRQNDNLGEGAEAETLRVSKHRRQSRIKLRGGVVTVFKKSLYYYSVC